MRQTRDILNLLEEKYSNIDYYYTIIDTIETNLEINPDIAIESCKALLEGLSKFIWKQIDTTYDSVVVDKMDFHPLVRQSMNLLSLHNEDIEVDFVNKVNKLIVSIGEVRNKRGDISHGKLSPKEYFSDSQFAQLVMNITDSMLYYVLFCFSKVRLLKELEYDDNLEFNEWLDAKYDTEIDELKDLKENLGSISMVAELRFRNFSKALFEQDKVAYKQELQNYLDTKETENTDV